MKVDVSKSRYHEAPGLTEDDFTRIEVKWCRQLLRRLRFLEQQIRLGGGMHNSSSGGAAFSEWEVEALEWVLTEIGYLEVREPKKGN